MSKRFPSQKEIDAFLDEPRLAMLLYRGARPSPTGVPVWFDWNGEVVSMFADRKSPKVQHLQDDPHASVLITNRVGEPEGWVAFDGKVEISDFTPETWVPLLDRVAPRYWDLSIPAYADEIAGWRSAHEAFVSLTLEPSGIRSGA